MLFGKKKTEERVISEPGKLYSVADGRLIPIDEVADEVFSQKMLGDGVALYSDNGVVYAPCDGKVGMIADSCHAVGVTADDGTDVLIHIGINTVEEKGRGFKLYVKKGDRVSVGDKLVGFDREALEKKGYDLVIPVVISDSDSLKSMTKRSAGPCKHGYEIISYEK